MPVLGLAGAAADRKAGRMSVRRWIQFVGGATVLVAGAVWMLLPTSGGDVDASTASPVANASAPLDVGPATGSSGHDHGNLPKGYVGPTLSPPLLLSSPGSDPTGPPPERQFLAAMNPSAGANNVQPVAGRTDTTMSVPCAAGQGRDLYREVRYHLRRNFGGLSTQLVHRSGADLKARARVQLLGGDGMMFDQWLEAGATKPVKVDLKRSDYLRIRVYCTSPVSSVEFWNALATR